MRAEDWGDILLEQWSDEPRRVPGWVQKPLACDVIAYAYAPSSVSYLLPVMPYSELGAAWAGMDQGLRAARAQNPGYVWVVVPMRRSVLM